MTISRRVAAGMLAGVLIFVGAAFFVVYPGGRGVGGDYRLVRAGDGTYQLQDTRQPENQLGNQGAVVRIGWDKHHIVVERLASPTRGTPWSNEAGWVIIDLDRRIVSPTMTEGQVRQRGDVVHIVTYSPDSAYEKGHRW
jgi:hypothetical protein